MDKKVKPEKHKNQPVENLSGTPPNTKPTLEDQVKEYLEGWQRTQAELVNYRKRMETEKMEFAKFASLSVIAKIIPVLENFDRALSNIPDKESPLYQGVAQTQKQLEAIVAAEGVQKMEDQTGKPFNPELHEALMQEEGAEDNMVTAQFESGYTMHGRVVKPAKVKVSIKK